MDVTRGGHRDARRAPVLLGGAGRGGLVAQGLGALRARHVPGLPHPGNAQGRPHLRGGAHAVPLVARRRHRHGGQDPLGGDVNARRRVRLAGQLGRGGRHARRHPRARGGGRGRLRARPARRASCRTRSRARAPSSSTSTRCSSPGSSRLGSWSPGRGRSGPLTGARRSPGRPAGCRGRARAVPGRPRGSPSRRAGCRGGSRRACAPRSRPSRARATRGR